jgi:hypothetical protein
MDQNKGANVKKGRPYRCAHRNRRVARKISVKKVGEVSDTDFPDVVFGRAGYKNEETLSGEICQTNPGRGFGVRTVFFPQMRRERERNNA